MPSMLAALSCVCSFAGLLLLLTTVIPGDKMNDKGEIVSYEILWSSWLGPCLISEAISLIIFARAVFKQQRWTRFAPPLFFIAMTSYALGWQPENRNDILFSAAPWTFISIWYFFWKKNVVAYYQN